MLSHVMLWSLLALVGGGISVLAGLLGLAMLLAFARRSVQERGRARHRLLITGSVLLILIGSSLLAFGIIRPLELLRLEIITFEKIGEITDLVRASYSRQAEQAIQAALSQPKYQDPKRLSKHEFRAFSQSGEDGIIAEIFRRIGTTNRYYVEFGAADGFENNTVLLLLQGWSGLWIEADPARVDRAKGHFRSEIEGKRLTVMQAFITAENIEDLFRRGKVPEEFDLLSIDIDRNDYYVWEKITHYRPRAVVIECNPIFPPTMSWVVPYDPKAMWDGTTRTGASLEDTRGQEGLQSRGL